MALKSSAGYPGVSREGCWKELLLGTHSFPWGLHYQPRLVMNESETWKGAIGRNGMEVNLSSVLLLDLCAIHRYALLNPLNNITIIHLPPPFPMIFFSSLLQQMILGIRVGWRNGQIIFLQLLLLVSL